MQSSTAACQQNWWNLFLKTQPFTVSGNSPKGTKQMKKKFIQENLLKLSNSNIKNLRYADDTTFMAEREQELKNLLIKVKEESEKAGLKLNIQKTKMVASTSRQIDGETVTGFIWGGSKMTSDGDCSHKIKKKNAYSLEWKLWTN